MCFEVVLNCLRDFSILVTDPLVEITFAQVRLAYSVVVCDMAEVELLTVDFPVISTVSGLAFPRLLMSGGDLDTELVVSGVPMTETIQPFTNDMAVGGENDGFLIH